MHLTWHDYKYYPYERTLAAREAASLFNYPILREVADGIEVVGETDSESAARLTYFSKIVNNHSTVETLQSRLESSVCLGKSRQATRYSVHGLHEYKGKFNPQVVRAILNIFGVEPGQRVLDPFCGSGTTLVECAHIGALGHGVDLNPFAIFISNVKLQALVTPSEELFAVLEELTSSLTRIDDRQSAAADNSRTRYLRSWFDLEILQTIEDIRAKIVKFAGSTAPIFLTVASNLLREYSRQDPKDLRIRRRKSPLPDMPFELAFLAACNTAVKRIEAVQSIIGTDLSLGRASLCDVASFNSPATFDAVITSPPYAMALPYIDTHRLSLVWLELLEPERILDLEAELVGSREFRGNARKRMAHALESNDQCLPESEARFCQSLQRSLSDDDGFRRRAVPMLLYRYFASMQRSFRTIRSIVCTDAPFALIVGHNHSVLGGDRYDFNTPAHLASISSEVGWTIEELIPLQTYRRYGYHMSNAVSAETLVILRNS